jgi:RHS repeat-associated protein
VAPNTPSIGDKRLRLSYDYRGGQPVEHHYYVWGLDLRDTLQGAGGVGGLLATIRDDSVYHYLYDANGNVMQLVNTAGPDDLTAADNPFRFSTKYYDKESGLSYYGYRYYSPELGRWMNRDPIGEKGGLNLYGFVLNDGVNKIDFHGKYTLGDAKSSICNDYCKNASGVFSAYCLDTCYKGLVDKEIFAEWLTLEKGNTSWLEEVKRIPCPKKLCISKGKPQNPDSTRWKDPGSANSEHSPAVYEMRSLPTAGGHANQCCYDGKGKVMTGIPAGGTADYVSHGFGSGHFFHDLQPWWLAKKLYRQWDYYSVRPVIIER